MPGEWSYQAQVVVHGSISGQTTANVLHFAQPGPLDVFDPVTVGEQLKALANAVHQCIVDTFISAATADWRYFHTQAKSMLGDGVEVTNDNPAVVQGEAGVQGVNVACQLIHVKSFAGGRNGRGRNFWAPGGENVASAGEWDPAALVLLAAFCACMAGKFIGAEATTPWRLGVLSRELFGGLFGNWDAAFFEAKQLEPEVIISTMGTRRKGTGS